MLDFLVVEVFDRERLDDVCDELRVEIRLADARVVQVAHGALALGAADGQGQGRNSRCDTVR